MVLLRLLPKAPKPAALSSDQKVKPRLICYRVLPRPPPKNCQACTAELPVNKSSG